jgi:translation elongation factor P/translation initiation factor 5A
MKKQAKDLKSGERIEIAGQTCRILNAELSDIGKQGKRKCRLELLTDKNEKIVIVRPEDYPFDCL